MIKPQKTINQTTELLLLTNLIKSMWNGTDSSDFDCYVKNAFEAGLSAGRYWINEYPLFAVGKIIANKTEGVIDPIESRKNMSFEGRDSASLYDALCIFSNFVSRNISDIYHSQTAYGYFDFSSSADKLNRELKKQFHMADLKPKKLSKQEQDGFVSGYTGVSASDPGSISTPEKITPRQTNYSNDEQSINYARWLTASIYSHGIKCSEVSNTINLLNTLVPVYEKYANSPINFDNGDMFLSMTKENEFIQIALKIAPPEFSSTDEFNESQKKAQAHNEMKKTETPAQKALREEQFEMEMSEMFKSLGSNEDLGKKEVVRNDRIRELISKHNFK